MDSPQARRHLELRFPGLLADKHKITSPPSRLYNCIAYAAGDDQRWWEPIDRPGCFWPSDVPEGHTIEIYVELFRWCGYEVCSKDARTASDQIALYAIGEMPTHATRQIENGHWSSKLGSEFDISHERATSLEGTEYGSIVVYMERRRSASAP